MYSPKAGQFLSEDMIEFDGGDTNLHRYCGNSPTNATDPSGESDDEWQRYWSYLDAAEEAFFEGTATDEQIDALYDSYGPEFFAPPAPTPPGPAPVPPRSALETPPATPTSIQQQALDIGGDEPAAAAIAANALQRKGDDVRRAEDWVDDTLAPAFSNNSEMGTEIQHARLILQRLPGGNR
jgi:hypothetical protein